MFLELLFYFIQHFIFFFETIKKLHKIVFSNGLLNDFLHVLKLLAGNGTFWKLLLKVVEREETIVNTFPDNDIAMLFVRLRNNKRSSNFRRLSLRHNSKMYANNVAHR